MQRTIERLRNKWKDVEIEAMFGVSQNNEVLGFTMTYKFKNKYISIYFAYDDLSDNIYNDIEKPILEYKNKQRENKIKRLI